MSDVYVCMHKHARLEECGGMFPQEIRCSDIASETILGQKQSHSSSMVRGGVQNLDSGLCTGVWTGQWTGFWTQLDSKICSRAAV